MYPEVRRAYGLMGDATKKQIEYAEMIHEVTGAGLPTEMTKQAYSDYISTNVREYKRVCEEMRLDHELRMESIDARRDW